MPADVAVTWVGNIGSGVSWPLSFLVRVCEGGTTGGGGGGGISPSDTVSGGCSRLLERWRMVWLKHSLFSLSRRHYDRGEVGFRCRVLEFFLYRSFVYPTIRVADVVEGLT